MRRNNHPLLWPGILQLFLLTASSVQSIAQTFANPLLDYGPDPWAMYWDGTYYYMHTTGTDLTLWRTPDITDLRDAERKVVFNPAEQNPSLVEENGMYHIWAPEIHRIGGKWYIYYAADDGNTDNHQIYVLENTSDDPFSGEFKMKGRVQTDTDSNWAIDASVIEVGGELYMVWSGWRTRRISTETQCIYIARMSNPWTLATERVLLSMPQLEWERHYLNSDGTMPDHIIYVNEGPQPIISPDRRLIHIVYSASGCWTPYYCLGMLTASVGSNLLDAASWTKSSRPVFTQSPEKRVFSTGHNSFFTSPDGKEHYILYHARNVEKDLPGHGDMRTPHAQRFCWDSDGYPVFGKPVAEGQPMSKPSGTPAQPTR